MFAGERSGWARFGHALLALAFFVIGIVAFVHPGNTFAALAAVMSFYFVFKGMLDVHSRVALRPQVATWSLQLLLESLAGILIGFSAAGDFGQQKRSRSRRVGSRTPLRAHAAISAMHTRQLRPGSFGEIEPQARPPKPHLSRVKTGGKLWKRPTFFGVAARQGSRTRTCRTRF